MLVFGHPVSQVIPLWKYFPVKAIMLNAFQIAKAKRLYEKIREHGIREVFGIPDEVRVWLDSGGYQALRRGIKLKVEDVIKWYNEMKADYCIALDSPIAPNDPKAEKKVKDNIRNAKEMYRKVNCELLPVYHPVNDDLLWEYYQGYSFANMKAVGGLIPRILTQKNASRREGWDFLVRVREMESSWLHALGLGSPTTYPRLMSLGYQSADTQTWRHKAAYGKIVLPGRGERHITGKEIKFGRRKISEDEKEEAVRIARRLNFAWSQLVNDFKARAIFNAYVLHLVSTSPIPFPSRTA